VEGLIRDRHPTNVKIIPERNEYVDNKNDLGISKHSGIDARGSGILEFIGDS
jgi:hypothetical protein